MSSTGKGLASSLASSCLFGVLYYYATLLSPLNGIEIFGWRMIVTVPFLGVFVFLGGYGHQVKEVLTAVRVKKMMIPALCLSSFLLGIQLWQFMWAPLNGKALDVSLGFLLMPLVMVLCGKFLYGEQLLPFQKVAVLCAAVGVSYKVWHVGTFSLETMVVCIGFPAYFIVRKALKTEHIGGLLIDMFLMLPVAVYILWQAQSSVSILSSNSQMLLLILMLGVISALASACFVTAGKLLPFGLFGLLSYVEPILLVIVSFLLGEKIAFNEAPTYAGVFLAIFILTIGGWMNLKSKVPPRHR